MALEDEELIRRFLLHVLPKGLLDSPRVVLYSVDADTADFYAEILDRLRQQGTPIPTNDIWIAASAFQHGLKIFSPPFFLPTRSSIFRTAET